MSDVNAPKIDRLQALLARIQQRAGQPRPTRLQSSRLDLSDAPAEPMIIEPIAAHMKMPPRDEEPIELTRSKAPPLVQVIDTPPKDETAADETATVSGEYAVAEMALELEELGPADEYETSGEAVVEIDVGDPVDAIEVPSSRQQPAPQPPPAEATPEEEAPTSGRELVAAPHESARVMVAAPSSSREEEARVDDDAPIDLGDFGETPPPEPHAAHAQEQQADEQEDEESLAQTREMAVAPPIPAARIGPPSAPPPEPPPELPPPSSRRPRSDRPLAPPPPPPEPPAGMDSLRHTDVNIAAPIALAPPPPPLPEEREEPEEIEAPPVTRTGEELDLQVAPTPPVAPAAPAAPPPPPERVAIAVALQSPTAHVKPSVEQVVVAIEAVVIKPELTPVEVAKMVGAVREARPQSFGAMIDAALDL